jgi:hypothetical protein
MKKRVEKPSTNVALNLFATRRLFIFMISQQLLREIEREIERERERERERMSQANNNNNNKQTYVGITTAIDVASKRSAGQQRPQRTAHIDRQTSSHQSGGEERRGEERERERERERD